MGPATGRGPAGHEPAKPASDLGPDARGSASAIARARLCAEALARGGEADLAAMAEREGLSERYLRVQLPLAFLSPKVVEAIASGTISADVTLTRLWSAQPLSWTQQEEQLLGSACV